MKKLMLEKADRIYHLPPHIDDFLPRKGRKKMLGAEILDLARFNWPESDSDPDPTSVPEGPEGRAQQSTVWTNWPLFTVGMVQRGYSDDDIRKIIGGNVLRVARAVFTG